MPTTPPMPTTSVSASFDIDSGDFATISGKELIHITGGADQPGSYTVQPGDSLWSIAKKTRANGETTQQRLDTLENLNRDKSYKTNFNLIHPGDIVTTALPTPISVSQANR
jgi:nucleoid-associated protein YgaU